MKREKHHQKNYPLIAIFYLVVFLFLIFWDINFAFFWVVISLLDIFWEFNKKQKPFISPYLLFTLITLYYLGLISLVIINPQRYYLLAVIVGVASVTFLQQTHDLVLYHNEKKRKPFIDSQH